MVAIFNTTDPRTFWSGANASLSETSTPWYTSTLGPDRFEWYEDVLIDNKLNAFDDDPLVQSNPNDHIIGHNLYYRDSMPPTSMRQDPLRPGYPQPINDELLRKVLQRGYYRNLYPDGRFSLADKVEHIPGAVVCDEPLDLPPDAIGRRD